MGTRSNLCNNGESFRHTPSAPDLHEWRMHLDFYTLLLDQYMFLGPIISRYVFKGLTFTSGILRV